MKAINDYINESGLTRKLTTIDEKNLLIVADEIEEIVKQISKWVEQNEDNEGTNTDTLGRLLDHVVGQLRGEWDEEIIFDF